MLEFVFYWLISALVTFWLILIFATGRKGWRRRLGIILPLMLPLLPYGIVEVRTLVWRSELYPPAKEAALGTGLLSDNITKLLVLEKGERRAKVYVTIGEKGEASGHVFTLARKGNGWESAGWDTIWSDMGSAEGNIFPPYLQ